MFVFDTSLTKLFYIFKIVFFCFVDDCDKFIIRVFVLWFEIRVVGFFGAYCLFKVDSVYQLRDLNDSFITSIAKTAMLKSDLWVGAKVIDELAFFFYKYSFFSTANIRYKKIFLPTSYSQCIFSLLRYYGIRIIMINDAWLSKLI